MNIRRTTNRAYKGLERRSSFERRCGSDRRDLVRFEALGSDRRLGTTRREEEAYWKTYK